MEEGEIIRIAGRDVRVTRPQKVLFPEDGITKRDLIAYYERIAPWILPHLQGRPLALERYPDGIARPGFFQKAASAYYPDWIKTVVVKKTGGTVQHVICDDTATVVYLANQACVTPHLWLSRAEKLDRPDQLVFDLDPGTNNFEAVKATARSLKQLLDWLDLPAYLKTTGSRGLHVIVPLKPAETFESVRSFARSCARLVVSQAPAQRTMEERKNARGERVFVDTNRNAYAQLIAPAYAVRARRGAPVSTPIDWSELAANDLRPDGVTIQNIFSRLKRTEDPWKNFWLQVASLDEARRKLKSA